VVFSAEDAQYIYARKIPAREPKRTKKDVKNVKHFIFVVRIEVYPIVINVTYSHAIDSKALQRDGSNMDRTLSTTKSYFQNWERIPFLHCTMKK